MNHRMLFAGIILLLVNTVTACTGSSDPIGVNTDFTGTGQATAGLGGSQSLWGLWECYMEPGGNQIEVVPLRTASFTANVNSLLEGQPGNLLIEDMDVTDLFTLGRLDCTVTLKHPLPGLDMYDGFDVWGVFMHNGSSSLGYDGLTYGDVTSGDDAVLLNPDGYSRWFNFTEFSGDGPPILTYWPGALSDLPDPSAMLNGYKIFADGLGFEDDYYQWITAPGNADDRGIFRAGSSNSRRYELKFPVFGGNPVVNFQYAVIATWEPGDPTLTGGPSSYEPGDFPSSANCEEAFFLNVSTVESELYNDGQGDFGGTFRANIEVFDWQGGSVGGLGVPNEIQRLILEGDFIPGGSQEFNQTELGTIATDGTVNSSVFQIEIVGCAPGDVAEEDFWVIVEAAGLNGDSFEQGFPTPYPDGAARASFLPGTVAVSGESPLDVIYVDDSNTSGIEDGTQTNPFNTIQEGVDAAALLEGYEVWVDDSGNPYEEQVNMVSDAIVLSVNWDESDGGNRAFIDGPETPDTHSVHFYNVDNAILDGFRIGFAGPCDGYDWTQMIRIDGGSNITVRDCLFTGQTNRNTVFPLVIYNASGVEIANCRLADIDRGASETGCAWFRGIYAQSCPGLIIRNNIIANIRSTEDEASKEINIIEIAGSSGIVIKNNLIHHIIPHAGVGFMGAILMKGIFIKNCPNAELVNNTVDNEDSSDAFFINQIMAYFIEESDGNTFTNNIITHIYSSGFPQPLARGVQAYNCTVVCDFTDIYDIGPGSNGAEYYGGASPGTGAINADPLYIDPDNEGYDVSDVSPARWGDPSFVDWDDTGAPSNDPDDYDPNTRSRMGCHGGPGGETVGLLTPQ